MMEQVEILSTSLLLEPLPYRLRHSIMRELNNKYYLAIGDSYGTIQNVYRWPSAHTSAPHPSKNSTRNDEFCSYTAKANCGRADAAGVCIVKPQICYQLYKPVCGCDGKTYGNDCERQIAGVQKDHDGECATQAPRCGGIAGTPCGKGEYCDRVKLRL